MRQQDKMVHENVDGSGIGKHMLQMMEHFVKLTKKHCRYHCNHKDGWMKRLFRYLDCVTIGAVGYDLIDFKNCKKEFNQQHNLIYDKIRTPALEKEIIRTMPPIFFKYWKLICNLKFGDKIDQEIIDKWNEHLKSTDSNNCYNQLPKKQTQSSYIDTYDSESSVSTNAENDSGMRKKTRSEKLKQMQNHMLVQSQSQSQSQFQ